MVWTLNRTEENEVAYAFTVRSEKRSRGNVFSCGICFTAALEVEEGENFVGFTVEYLLLIEFEVRIAKRASPENRPIMARVLFVRHNKDRTKKRKENSSGTQFPNPNTTNTTITTLVPIRSIVERCALYRKCSALTGSSLSSSQNPRSTLHLSIFVYRQYVPVIHFFYLEINGEFLYKWRELKMNPALLFNALQENLPPLGYRLNSSSMARVGNLLRNKVFVVMKLR